MIPTQPGVRLVDVTEQLSPKLNELQLAITQLLNARQDALSVLYGIPDDQAEFMKLPEATRVAFKGAQILETFASIAVMGSMSKAAFVTFDPGTQAMLKTIVDYGATLIPAPDAIKGDFMRYISTEPAGCDDPTCAGCVARRAKLERERA